MDPTGGDEGMYPRPLGVADGFPSGPDVLLVAPGEAANDGHVAIVGVEGVTDLEGDDLDGLEVVLGGGGEAGLDDVDAELGELAGDVELLLGGHGGAGGLLAVAEGGVEDADVPGVGDAAGDVGRAAGGRRGSGGGASDGGAGR